jgi:drug/metabolite transporter (DMT)-like permease
MDILAVPAVLAASLLHASWHALIKSSEDRVTALAGMNLVSGLVAVALLPIARPLPATILPIIALSVALHVGYKLALARAFAGADLGQAYPLARGFVPIAAAVLAVPLLQELPKPAELSGIVLVCIGIAVLALEPGAQRLRPRTIAAAFIAGGAVATYSVVDAYGIRTAGDWFSFTVWLVAFDSGAFVAYAATRRRRVLAAWRSGWQRMLGSGLLGLASFGIFMWALGVLPVGVVAALRETSIVFAALLGVFLLRERATWRRGIAAGTVACGIAVIAAGL